jgi:hypothetical protein
MYPKAYNKVLEINSGNGSIAERSKVKWDKYSYRKTHISSFELSDFEKVDCNSPDLERGKFINQDDASNIKLFLTKCVREFILKKLESKFIRLNSVVIEKKKTVKKGFLGFFKKEEKIVMKDGKYVFTDVEKSVKDFADMAFCMGIYDVAFKEYKYLHDELKKRSEFWTGLILEKMIYCLLVKNAGCPNKKEISQVSNYLVSLSSLSYNLLHRLTRASCLLNYFIHIQYENQIEPNTNLVVTLSNQAFRYKERKEIEIRIFFPLIKEQIARYSILRRKKNVRKFVYFNIIAASHFVSEKSMSLEAHGMACYIIASKFYEMQGLNSWNLILEFAFYNLGGLYLS